MEKAAEILEKVAISLDKYKKNKTLVSPADLAGKYKLPFQKLKQQLKEELEAYLTAHSLEDLKVRQDKNLDEFSQAVDKVYKDSGISIKVGKAAFRDFDLERVKQLAEQLRAKVYEEAWKPYMQKYICLYATAECFSPENPQTPRIYNSLVDKFYHEESGEWIADNTATTPAFLIYIQDQ